MIELLVGWLLVGAVKEAKGDFDGDRRRGDPLSRRCRRCGARRGKNCGGWFVEYDRPHPER